MAFVVYHEMLHARQPAGTRRWHGREFHAAERSHPDWRRAREWEKQNLAVLMRAKRARPVAGGEARPVRKPVAARLAALVGRIFQPSLF